MSGWLSYKHYNYNLLNERFAKIKESVHIFSYFFIGKLTEPPKDKTVSHKKSCSVMLLGDERVHVPVTVSFVHRKG